MNFSFRCTLCKRGCLCDNCTPSFLPLLIFDWRTCRGELEHGGDDSQQKISVDQSELEK